MLVNLYAWGASVRALNDAVVYVCTTQIPEWEAKYVWLTVLHTCSAHTENILFSHCSPRVVAPEMSKKLLWTFYFHHFLFCLGTIFFFSEVTVLIFLSYAQCDTQTLNQNVEAQLLSQDLLLLIEERVLRCQWSYMPWNKCTLYCLRNNKYYHVKFFPYEPILFVQTK